MTDDIEIVGRDDAGWDRVVGELRRAPRVDAHAIGRVMDEVLAGGAPAAIDTARLALVGAAAPARPVRRRGVVAWLMRPRMIALTPMHAIAAALLLAVAIGSALRWNRDTVRVASQPNAGELPTRGAVPVSLAADTARRVVQFVFVSQSAREVAIVGDFNNWQAGATPLRRASPTGLWTVEVGLEPGRYTYAFVVDGTRWVPDDTAPRARDDEFGGEKSVIYVRKQT